MDKLELARLALEEFNRTQRASRYFADDVVWDLSGFEGWVEATEYHGPEAFDAQMARWTEPFASWSMEITDLIDVGGDDLLAVGVQRAVLEGSAATIEMPVAVIWTIRDDKVRRIRMFMRPEDAYEAARAPR
jgi:ketosteroid isomerase-like protein